MMKRFCRIILACLAILATDSKVMADDGAAVCSETKYGTGRPISGGCFELDVETISKCDKMIRVYANYSWEGKDGEGKSCSGSKEKDYVMYLMPKQARTGHVTACRCFKVERAWIDGIIVEFW